MTTHGDVNSSHARGMRLDVQGLRAIAVLSVVAAHADLPLPGGFVGVDMFFAISGFIITLMLLREHSATGRIDFVRFYSRRFMRLAPALALAIAALAVISFLLSTPSAQERTYQAATGATFAVANAVIGITSGAYFGGWAEENAALHLWSLSVEEQFYLLFPLLLVFGFFLTRRVSPKLSAWVLSIVFAVVGFASLVSISGFGPFVSDEFPLGYFGPIPRAYEFLAGACVAVLATQLARIPGWLRTVAGIAGLAALAASFILITPLTPFPGKWTLLPIAGTLLSICAGLGTTTLPSRLLSVRPLVAIGNWSYSLYLWHWPLIVAAKSVFPFSDWAPSVAAAISVVPAYLSYRFVESPMRRIRWKSAKQAVRWVAGVLAVPAMSVAACWLALALIVTPAYAPGGGWASRFDSIARPQDTTASFDDCTDEFLITFPMAVCKTTSELAPQVLLIGDSHSEHLLWSLNRINPDLPITNLSVRAPYPLGSPGALSAFIQWVAGQRSITTVIFSGWLTRDPSGILPEQSAGVRQLASEITAIDRSLYILDDGPTWPNDPFRCSHRKAVAMPGTECDISRAEFLPTVSQIDQQLELAIAGTPGVELVHTYGAFCDDDSCFRANRSSLLYSDGSHLTHEGATLLLEKGFVDSPAFRRAILGN